LTNVTLDINILNIKKIPRHRHYHVTTKTSGYVLVVVSVQNKVVS